MVVGKLLILTEDMFGNYVWKEVSKINLGSLAKPNKKVLQVKIIT